MSKNQVNDPYAPQEKVYTNYGEIVFKGLFKGLFISGQGCVDYIQGVHDYSFNLIGFTAFPIGRDESDYPQNLKVDDKRWKVFADSVEEVVDSRAKFLNDNTGGSFYAKWQKVKAGKYKSNAFDESGRPIWKDQYGYEILAVYPDLSTAHEARNKAFGIETPVDNDLPTETAVATHTPLADILPFAETMARQYIGADHKVDLVKFMAGVDASSMFTGFYNLGDDGNPIEPKAFCNEVLAIVAKINNEPIL